MMTNGKKFWLPVIFAGFCCAGVVWGQEPAATGSSEAPSFDSISKLNRFYDDRLEEARQNIEQQRLTALEAYLPKVSGEEQAEVLVMMMESAIILEKYDKVLSLSKTYLDNHSNHAAVWNVRGMRYASLIQEDKIDQAHEGWKEASENFDKQDWQAVYGIGMQIAEGYLNRLNADKARKIYDTLSQKLSFVVDIQQALRPHLDALSWIGKEAPELKGTSLEGKELSLEDYKGKIVLIDFWASWCPPCLAALPELEDVYRRFHNRGFEVIGVSLDHSEDMLKQFLEKNPLPWPNIYDGYYDGPLAQRYEVEGIPKTFIVNRQGKIIRATKPASGFAPLIERLVTREEDASQ